MYTQMRSPSLEKLAAVRYPLIGAEEMQRHMDYSARFAARPLAGEELDRYLYVKGARHLSDEDNIALAIQHNYALRTGEALPGASGAPVTVDARQKLDTILTLSTTSVLLPWDLRRFLDETDYEPHAGRILAAQIADVYMTALEFGMDAEQSAETYIDTAHHLLYSPSANRNNFDRYSSILSCAGLDYLLTHTPQ